MLRPRLCPIRTVKVAELSQMLGVKPVECGDVLRTPLCLDTGYCCLRLSGTLDSPPWLSDSIMHCELRSDPSRATMQSNGQVPNQQREAAGASRTPLRFPSTGPSEPTGGCSRRPEGAQRRARKAQVTTSGLFGHHTGR